MKKARSTLRRSLHTLKESYFAAKEEVAEFHRLQQEARYAQHLLPDSDVLDRLLRYRREIDRELYRAIAELERLQRQRLGNAVPDPLKLTM